MRTLRLPLLAVAAATLLAVGLTSPALAAPVLGSPASSCVVRAQPLDGAPDPVDVTCFRSLAAAVAYATSGAVHIAPNTNELTQEQLDGGTRAVSARGAKANRIIGIEYEDPRFEGSTKVYNVAATPCNDGGRYTDTDLRGDPMDDEISSARTYEGCVSRHYQYAGFSGMSHDCGCAVMGDMNDRTTSIRWT
ncbi:MAG: hypothetical protein GEV10_11995 [Streptosporangiales bacterium]|nr:hypothetical protein [Streptosporangiales bacterium]